ncbi:hypothetical protein ZIOFF_071437 [Zingiber officinale]|uniref:Piwi domain-containing protein n=1 Tax=Zingiber officinale TaxID=94328 RepID=A0A8J5EUF6_ZINOF|nr:hypothetical protein ZIOFF_071437 [Zingiber officinale]
MTTGEAATSPKVGVAFSNHLWHVESMSLHPLGVGRISHLNVVILSEPLESKENDLVFPSQEFSSQALVSSPKQVYMLHSKAIENNLDCRFVDFPNDMHMDTWYSGGDRYWQTIQLFLDQYVTEFKEFNANAKNDPVLHPLITRPNHVERALSAHYHDAMTILQPQGKELDLLIVILPDNDGSLYGDQKQICETGLGLVSQCCLTKHVFKMSKQYLTNGLLSILRYAILLNLTSTCAAMQAFK